MLAAEPVSTNPTHITPTGIITVNNGDPMVMYSGKCRNSIKESSSSMKDRISVKQIFYSYSQKCKPLSHNEYVRGF